MAGWTRGPAAGDGSRGRPGCRRPGTSWVLTRCTCCLTTWPRRSPPGGAPGVSCCALRVISMDGSTTGVPDSAENGAFFGRPSTAGRDGAFPHVRWLVTAGSGTGALTGAAFGRHGTREQTLALDLLPSFGPEMLVLADRNFLSWSLARAVLATGAHLVACLGELHAQTRWRCCPTARTWPS